MLNKKWLIILYILVLGVFTSSYVDIPASNSAPVVPIAIDDHTSPPDKNKVIPDSKDDNHKKPKECLKNLNKRQNIQNISNADLDKIYIFLNLINIFH